MTIAQCSTSTMRSCSTFCYVIYHRSWWCCGHRLSIVSVTRRCIAILRCSRRVIIARLYNIVSTIIPNLRPPVIVFHPWRSMTVASVNQPWRLLQRLVHLLTRLKRMSQLRFELDSSAIRARFDSRTLSQLRFELDSSSIRAFGKEWTWLFIFFYSRMVL